MYVVVHTSRSDSGGLVGDTRRIVNNLAVGTPVFEVATGEELRIRATAVERLAALLSGVVAGAALLIAVFGVHAIVACSVAERRRELGLRMALGATRWQCARLVFADAGWMSAAGAVTGVGLTVLALQSLAAVLPGLTPDAAWPLIAGVGLGMLGAGLAAAAPAARRAATTDPARVLQDVAS